MGIKDLVTRTGKDRKEVKRNEDSVFSLQRDMNKLFDDFLDDFRLAPFRVEKGAPAAFIPSINVSETEKEIAVSAELPGMDEKDVTVELDDDVLTLKGEKKMETDEKGKGWHRIEHRYGSFQRSIQLPAGVDASKVKSTYKKGILNVTLPKLPEEQGKKKTISITNE